MGLVGAVNMGQVALTNFCMIFRYFTSFDELFFFIKSMRSYQRRAHHTKTPNNVIRNTVDAVLINGSSFSILLKLLIFLRESNYKFN